MGPAGPANRKALARAGSPVSCTEIEACEHRLVRPTGGRLPRQAPSNLLPPGSQCTAPGWC